MLPLIYKRFYLVRFGLMAATGIALTACSGLNQKPYDVDGIYNNSKIVVEDTHEKSAYYSEYFKQKEEEANQYFTDVENYSSNYNEGNGAWGDTTSETRIVYNYPYSYFGFGYPYGGWYDSWGWGFGFGWGFGWGYPYYGYGWGYPYYGWGYPYYSGRTLSRSNSYRSLTSRQMALSNAGRMNNNPGTRTLRNSSLNSARNLVKTDRTFSRANTSFNRMNTSNTLQTRRATNFDTPATIRNERFNNNTRYNTTRNTGTRFERSTTRPVYTPAPTTRMNSGSMGGSRGGGSVGGGMRTGGGGRR